MNEQVRAGAPIDALSRAASLEVTSATLADGVHLHYAEQGDPGGVPVLLLYGYVDSWRSFEPVLAQLPRGLHVFAVSQRGHGESESPSQGYRPRDFAADAAAFMDAVGIRPRGHRRLFHGQCRGATTGDRPSRADTRAGAAGLHPHNARQSRPAGAMGQCRLDAERSGRTGLRARLPGKHSGAKRARRVH